MGYRNKEIGWSQEAILLQEVLKQLERLAGAIGSGGGGGGSSIYNGTSPTTITVGGLPAGTPITGLTYTEIFQLMLSAFVTPTVGTFTMSSQALTIEVGTALSGNKTFNWTFNSVATVQDNTINIIDVTNANTPLVGGTNLSKALTTISLPIGNVFPTGSTTQVWKLTGIDTHAVPFSTGTGGGNANNITINIRFNRWWGPVAAYPLGGNTAAQNRAYAIGLPSTGVQTPGVNSFTLVTGTTQINFIVLLPPGITITSVIDTTNGNTNLTSFYVASTLSINDAGGRPVTYNMYQYTVASPYSLSANHSITTT